MYCFFLICFFFFRYLHSRAGVAGPCWKGVLTHLDHGCLERGCLERGCLERVLPSHSTFSSVFMWSRGRISESAPHKLRHTLNVFFLCVCLFVCLLFSVYFFVCLFVFVCFWCVYRFAGVCVMRRVAHLLFPSLPASASLHLSTAGFHQSLSCLTTAIHQRTMPAASIVVKSRGLVPTV